MVRRGLGSGCTADSEKHWFCVIKSHQNLENLVQNPLAFVRKRVDQNICSKTKKANLMLDQK